MEKHALSDLTPVEFEEFCVDLLGFMGFKVDWRKGSNTSASTADGGVDIIAIYPREDPDGSLYEERWFVECKHSTLRAISKLEVEKLHLASKGRDEKAHVLLFMTSGALGNSAKDYIATLRRSEQPLRILYWERKHLEKLLRRMSSDTSSGPDRSLLFLEAKTRLTHDDVQVRTGGLEMLEELAVSSPSKRQAVMRAMCQYLRNDYRETVDDAHVFAQDVISRHVAWPAPRRDQEPPTDYWPDMEIDLTGARLKDLDLDNACIRSAIFDDAEFLGDVRLQECLIEESLSLRHARVEGNFWFSGSKVGGSASFSATTFGGSAYLGRSVFRGDTDFDHCRFHQHASFVSCDFRGAATFRDTSFIESADFTSLRVKRDAIFKDATFNDTTFELAEFGDFVNFGGVSASRDELNLSRARVVQKLLGNIWPLGYVERPENSRMSLVVRVPDIRLR
ncbi:pentapeptide repeat-containing protein [Herbidospora yilanensis]|uniref:pentapeptide repeat-containing protein n=1 Tax=Herbidospora yilanensis TaxID=354426 RepID=UPI000783B1A0|nr:pentapeptide repeat-containing protein [Herbidospora yilanensis]